MENNKLNRIKEGHKLLSLLERKELKDCMMVDDTAILYYGKGDVFLIKAYSKEAIEAIGNRDINKLYECTFKESEDKNGK